MWNRSIALFGLLGLYLSVIKSCHSFLAARNLLASSKKSLWQLKKKDSLGANVSMSGHYLRGFTYSNAFEIVKATSCMAVEPASLM